MLSIVLRSVHYPLSYEISPREKVKWNTTLFDSTLNSTLKGKIYNWSSSFGTNTLDFKLNLKHPECIKKCFCGEILLIDGNEGSHNNDCIMSCFILKAEWMLHIYDWNTLYICDINDSILQENCYE